MSMFECKRIAIIGGGISGLSCAQRLLQIGNNNVVVFDTGKRNIGGRCSTRNIDGIVFDHSSQYMTVNDNSDFRKELQQYIDMNVIKQWNGRITTLTNNGLIELQDTSNTKRFVGSSGMMLFSDALSKNLSLRRPVWVSKLIKQDNNKWKLMQFNDDLGDFDIVVIAHNGKCADKLMSTTPHTILHDRLKVSFGPTLPQPAHMKKMQLSSLWVGTFAVKKGTINSDFGDAMIVNNDSPLSWICCTSRKIGQNHPKYESYTVISTREFAAANKVPQEAVPKDMEIEVKNILLRSFESALGLTSQSVVPIQYKIQLWGAAVPLNKYSSSYVLDVKNSIGICGDWMNSSAYTSGPNIETAFMSGFKLADALMEDELKDAGLSDSDCYLALNTHAIGDVVPSVSTNHVVKGPPLNSLIQSSSSNNYKNNNNNNNNNRNRNRNRNQTNNKNQTTTKVP